VSFPEHQEKAMRKNDVEHAPGTASAEEGNVYLDGPDGVAIAMSPDSAEETGKRLIAAAQEARAQLKD
jgi:hypothetical protein